MANELSKIETGYGIGILLSRWGVANKLDASQYWDELGDLLHGGYVFATDDELVEELLMLRDIAGVRAQEASK